MNLDLTTSNQAFQFYPNPKGNNETRNTKGIRDFSIFISRVEGRIRASQSHLIETSGILPQNRKETEVYARNTIHNQRGLIVSYEVPTAEQRELVKKRFQSTTH